jgi:hypothetical protein
MGALLVKCPVTGREFSSGIQVERDEVKRFPNSLTHSHCPDCGLEHVWWTSEGRFVETLPPEDWIENKS